MQYSISNLNAFIILISIGFSLYYYVNDNEEYKELADKNNSPIQLISQMQGYFYINPVLALSLTITIFSFVGIPPLIGFFAKQMVLSAALDSGYVFLALVGILTSVISAVYVRPLIIRTPGSLNLTLETFKIIGYKPVNLSDFEMNRGVQHVDNSSYGPLGRLIVSNIKAVFLYLASNWLLTTAMMVPLSHVIFNLPVSFAQVKSFVIVSMISLKSRLRDMVSFDRPETISLRKLAKRRITDVLIGTGDLLRGEISKIRFKLVSSTFLFFSLSSLQNKRKEGNVEGRRSFRSIFRQIFGFNPSLLIFFPFFLIIIKLLHISLYIIIKKRKKKREGKQNQANNRLKLKLRSNYNGLILPYSLLVRPSELTVKLAQTYHIKHYSTLKYKTGPSP
jgi:hypothetical protein